MNQATAKLFLAIVLLVSAASASAHSGHSTSSFIAGLIHPFGADHLLAMLVVGSWSRIAWSTNRLILGPFAFIAALVAGAIASLLFEPQLNQMSHASTAYLVDVLSALSVVALIALLVFSLKRVPIAFGLILIATSGLIHGMAHGLETPSIHISDYFSGFVLTSIGLHLVGLLVTSAIIRQRHARCRANNED